MACGVVGDFVLGGVPWCFVDMVVYTFLRTVPRHEALRLGWAGRSFSSNKCHVTIIMQNAEVHVLLKITKPLFNFMQVFFVTSS